jgi:cell division septation protein DedD
LILIFLAGVAVCAVFFSLGFLVGFNERFSRSTPTSEVVTAPAAIPPTVNPPVENVPATPPGPPALSNPTPDAGLTPPAGEGSKPSEPASKKTVAEAPPTQPAPPADVKEKPEVPPPPRAAAGEVGEGVTLQVAALRTKQDAEALVGILKGRGYPVFLVSPEYAKADDNLFRVQVGPFKTRDDAEKVRAKLAQEGFKPFIRH